MAVVSISRQYGAGGHLVGEIVARRLGYKLVDRAVLTKVAEQAGVTVKWVEDVEKEAGGLLSRLVNEWLKGSAYVRNLPDFTTQFDEKAYRVFLARAIGELAAQDKVVFMGRGSQYILKDDPRAVRVYLVAEEENRLQGLMEHYGVDRARAEEVARKEEKKRLAFLRAFEQGEPEDPRLYHLVINTSLVDLQTAADLVSRLVEDKGA